MIAANNRYYSMRVDEGRHTYFAGILSRAIKTKVRTVRSKERGEERAQ